MSDHETEQRDQREAEGLSNAILLDSEADRLKREKAKQKRRRHTLRELQVWFNGILMVATIVTATIVLYQNHLMKLTLIEMEKQSTAAADAVQAAKDASKQNDEQARASLKTTTTQSKAALDASIETARTDQRAWVGFKSVKMVTLEVNKPMTVETIITNTGKTLALEVKALVSVKTNLGPLDIEAFASGPERRSREADQTPIALFPSFDLIFTMTTAGPLTERQLSDINERKALVYLIGDIDYQDVFKRHHITQLCGVYDSTTKRFTTCSRSRAN